MDREAVARLAGSEVRHGSSDDPDVLDFSANVNPRVPDGVADVYADALDGARSYPPEDYPEFRAAAAAYLDRDESSADTRCSSVSVDSLLDSIILAVWFPAL
jgi:histidinol-phosphate/aromatic aminotransferase/cobyric acid decarboxylase-like protein